MSTNSSIGLCRGNEILAITCNWDGYPEHNGRILLNHYTTPGKIINLLGGGDLSILGMDVGNRHDFDGPITTAVDEETRFAFESTYYRRDRQDWNAGVARVFWGRHDYRENSSGPFYYLFENNEWLVQWAGSPWMPLKDVILRIDQKKLQAPRPLLLPSPH
jgi:hypothetical protein